MKTLTHNYSNLAGRTVLWDTSDSKEWYEKNAKNLDTRRRLVELNFLDRPIEYTYNSHGFRTAEFDQPIDAVCFGCSFTMGTGIHYQDTWPAQLANLTGLRVANLGHAGSSNDTVFRFAQHYLPLLKPKYAVWLQTDRHRIEVLDDSIPLSMNILSTDTRNPCADDYFIKTWFSSDSNQILNQQKNTMAFRYLCQDLGITSVVLPREAVPQQKPFPGGNARDLCHPGSKEYAVIAQQVYDLLSLPNKA